MIAHAADLRQDRLWPAMWVVAAAAVLVAVPDLAMIGCAVAVACLAYWEIHQLLGRSNAAVWTLEFLLLMSWPLWLYGIRHQGGRGMLVLVIAVIFADDVSALYGGKRFGRHKLARRISPGKTVEGVGFGLAGALAVALVLNAALGLGLAVGLLVAATAILVAAGLAGDLTESWLKRQASVKDSGRLLHGHGGVLDRLDALLWATPIAVILLQVGWL